MDPEERILFRNHPGPCGFDIDSWERTIEDEDEGERDSMG
jgi:hypothetical protein